MALGIAEAAKKKYQKKGQPTFAEAVKAKTGQELNVSEINKKLADKAKRGGGGGGSKPTPSAQPTPTPVAEPTPAPTPESSKPSISQSEQYAAAQKQNITAIETKNIRGEVVGTRYFETNNGRGTEIGRIYKREGTTYAQTKKEAEFEKGGKQYSFKKEAVTITETKEPEPVATFQGGATVPVKDVSFLNELNLKKVTEQPNETKVETIFAKVKDIYSTANTKVREKVTEPVFNKLESYGINLTSPEYQALFMPSVIGVGPFGVQYPEQIKEFYGGFQAGVLRDVKEQPLKQVLTYGAGAAVGFAAQGVTTGVTVGTAKLFGSTVGAYAGASTRLAIMGVGAYYGGKAVYQIGQQVFGNTAYQVSPGNVTIIPKTYAERGEIAGVAFKDIFISAAGYQAGSKGFEQLRGYSYTRGRQYLEVKQGEYPQAPVKQQLKLFQQNVYPELGDKPGAFHTTSQIFWKDGVISPGQNSYSELPRSLYGSTEISTPFSRIAGSSSTINVPTGFKKWFLSLAPPVTPGSAYLKPKGFRASPVEKVEPYQIDGQTYTYRYKLPPSPGMADVPGIKTEIETTFRFGAGDYAFESGYSKYFTRINQVRVPIDVFSYAPGTAGTTTAQATALATGSYSLPTSVSVGSVSSLALVPYSYTPTPTPSYILSVDYSSITSSAPTTSGKITSSIPSYNPPSSSGRSSRVPSYIPPSYEPPSSPPPSYNPPSSKVPSYVPPSSKVPSYVPPSYTPPSKVPPSIPKIPSAQEPKLSTGKYPVLIRRFGKFKIAGYGKTPGQAVSIGKNIVGTTLARTFKVKGFKGFKIPGFKTKKSKKEGIVFIEPSARALSTKSEQKEIQIYKGMKGGSRKKK